MNPYLESDLWMTIHGHLASEIVRQLVPKLRPRYLALLQERFVMVTPDNLSVSEKNMYPDVGVAAWRPGPSVGGPTAVAAPLHLATVIPESIRQYSVEVRDVANRQLVTAIEVLSPTNKRGGGRDGYLNKRERLLRSSAHLLEIDLLRHGQRVPMTDPLPAAPYFVLLSRAPDRPMTEVWPVTLQERFPSIPVPLLPGDNEATLDLQGVLTTVYDAAGYDLAIDYTRPPEGPLSPADAAWIEELLRPLRGG
jgi:hypothetical protein